MRQQFFLLFYIVIFFVHRFGEPVVVVIDVMFEGKFLENSCAHQEKTYCSIIRPETERFGSM